MTKQIYFRVVSREDERCWKEFLRQYFPNHYAIGILDEDLFIGQNKGGLQAIGVGINGFGFVSVMCVVYAPQLFQRVNSFEEFKQTKVYQDIVSQGTCYDLGEPFVVKDMRKR